MADYTILDVYARRAEELMGICRQPMTIEGTGFNQGFFDLRAAQDEANRAEAARQHKSAKAKAAKQTKAMIAKNRAALAKIQAREAASRTR
jgi:hypothetical protein